jgi:hypothetical protein
MKSYPFVIDLGLSQALDASVGLETQGSEPRRGRETKTLKHLKRTTCSIYWSLRDTLSSEAYNWGSKMEIYTVTNTLPAAIYP